MRIAIVTDAWAPQVNGVVTTLQRTAAALETLGHEVRVLSANGHVTIPCPTYPEIRLALWPLKRLGAELDSFAPDAIHVATEGPLGMAAARYCTARRGAPACVHDVVSHAVSAVRVQARAEDLSKAALAALALDRENCRRVANGWTWARASAQFLGHLVRACDGHNLAAPVAVTAAS